MSGTNVAGTVIAASDNASPEVYTTVGSIENWTGPEISQGENDNTDITSVIATMKKNGVVDYGNLTLEILYDPANAQAVQLRSDAEGSTQRNYRITYTDSPQSTDIFGAHVVSFSSSGSKGDLLKASITLNIQTAIT